MLVTRPPGYALDIAPDQVDSVAFERAVQAAIAEHEAGRIEPAAESLAAALGLWRGQPLADVASEPWARVEGERLTELMEPLGYRRVARPGAATRARIAAHDGLFRLRESVDWQLQRLLQRD